jgi:glycosyltransferase involved in cell wall biosynthesis
VIDQLLSRHAELFSGSRHRMLVDRKIYDRVYGQLERHWKTAAFIPHTLPATLQQARWVWTNRPVAEQYWDDVDIMYCPAESYVPTAKVPLVGTIHDVAGFEDNLYPSNAEKRMHCMKWRMLFTRLAESADAVITVSRFSASRIARFFPELESRLHVIHNAPHHIFGSEVSSPTAQEADDLTAGRPFVLLPGGLSLRKNAELVVKVWPQFMETFPEMMLVVAGTCEGGYAKRLEACGSENLVVAGYVSDELLNALYQKAEVVWFPSRYEGFGMPVVESMAAGAPVVASAAASIPEVAGDAALLCGVDDPGEHVDAIGELLASAGKRDEMRARGLARAGCFSWTESANRLHGIFLSVQP